MKQTSRLSIKEYWLSLWNAPQAPLQTGTLDLFLSMRTRLSCERAVMLYKYMEIGLRLGFAILD